MEAILRGAKIPVLYAGYVLLLIVTLAVPLVMGYIGACIVAASSLASFLQMTGPTVLGKFFVPPLSWTNWTVGVGLRIACEAIADAEDAETQASVGSRLRCAVTAALVGSVLLRILGELLIALHAHPTLLTLFEAITTHNDSCSKGSDIVFYLVVTFYGMGWLLAPALHITRRRVVRGTPPVSYADLREAARELDRSESPAPKEK